MINNEKGSILCLTLTIALVMATLLLTLSQQLQSQTLLFEKRREYLTLTLLEKECLKFVLDEITDPLQTIPVTSDNSLCPAPSHHGRFHLPA